MEGLNHRNFSPLLSPFLLILQVSLREEMEVALKEGLREAERTVQVCGRYVGVKD